MFFSAESPKPHPADDERDALNVTDTEKLSDNIDSGKETFCVSGLLY